MATSCTQRKASIRHPRQEAFRPVGHLRLPRGLDPGRGRGATASPSTKRASDHAAPNRSALSKSRARCPQTRPADLSVYGRGAWPICASRGQAGRRTGCANHRIYESLAEARRHSRRPFWSMGKPVVSAQRRGSGSGDRAARDAFSTWKAAARSATPARSTTGPEDLEKPVWAVQVTETRRPVRRHDCSTLAQWSRAARCEVGDPA
jgi:hypothetical protein